MTEPREFEAVAACVRSSALFRAAGAVTSACLAAANRSAVAGRVRDARVRFASLPREERLRTIAILVATATAGHLLLLLFVPVQIAPATPKTLWAIVAVVASIVALCAGKVAESWETSATADLIRRSGAARKS